jgi:hypothetical protein
MKKYAVGLKDPIAGNFSIPANDSIRSSLPGKNEWSAKSQRCKMEIPLLKNVLNLEVQGRRHPECASVYFPGMVSFSDRHKIIKSIRPGSANTPLSEYQRGLEKRLSR